LSQYTEIDEKKKISAKKFTNLRKKVYKWTFFYGNPKNPVLALVFMTSSGILFGTTARARSATDPLAGFCPASQPCSGTRTVFHVRRCRG